MFGANCFRLNVAEAFLWKGSIIGNKIAELVSVVLLIHVSSVIRPMGHTGLRVVDFF